MKLDVVFIKFKQRHRKDVTLLRETLNIMHVDKKNSKLI